MKALVQTGNGSPEVLRVEERPEPEAGEGQVRIRVHASGLNFAEVQARLGLYPDAPPTPCVLGYEVAGEVDSVGPGAGTFKVGQKVIAGTMFGGFAELAVADQQDVVELPEDFSFEMGAAIPVVYITAYAAVVRFANLQPGERILIHAAAGGVGIAATQIASHIGAEIIGTASTPKHKAIRDQGVKHAIDYREVNVAKQVRRLTGGKGVDVVLDARGGRKFRESYRLLQPGGRLLVYGASELLTGDRRSIPRIARTLIQMPRFSALSLMKESKAVIGLNMIELWKHYGGLKQFIEPVLELMQKGAAQPLIAKTFPLERAADAHRYIQERRNIGKVVLTVFQQ